VQVAAQLGEPCLDIWTALHDFQSREGVQSPEQDWRSLLSDGLHLSDGGDEVVFAALTALIHEKLPSLLPEALPWDLPRHDIIESTAECGTYLAPYLPWQQYEGQQEM
jgi:hypothetical protein